MQIIAHQPELRPKFPFILGPADYLDYLALLEWIDPILVTYGLKKEFMHLAPVEREFHLAVTLRSLSDQPESVILTQPGQTPQPAIDLPPYGIVRHTFQ